MKNYSKMLCLELSICKWSPNFEDEIPLRGVKCNIPLVSLWINISRRIGWRNVKENKYDGSVYYVLAGTHKLSISVCVSD